MFRRLLSAIRTLPGVVLILNPAFRGWWLSSGLGQASVVLAPLALSWVVFEATDSSSWVGVVNGLPVAAIIPLTLAGGVLLDRIGRLRLFRQTHLGLAVVFGIVALALTSLPTIHPLLLVPVAAGIAAASSVLILASRLLVTDIVDRDLLASALSLSQLLRNLLVMVGPPILGIVILTGSVGLFFGLLSTIHLVGWVAALRIGTLKVAVPQESRAIVSDVIDGLRYCRQNTTVAWFLAIGVMAILANVYLPFLPFLARDRLEVGAGGFGLLVAAESSGGVFGSILLGTVWKIRRKGLSVILVTITYDIAMFILAFSGSIGLSLVSLFVIGFSGAVWITMMNTCIQLVTDSQMRGRVVAVWSTIARIVRPLGFLLGGALVLIDGPSIALLIASLTQFVLITLILVGVKSVRSVE